MFMMVKNNKKQEHTFSKKPNGKNATGRPTDYKPEYCQKMIEYFEQCKAEVLVDISFYNTNKEEVISQIINPIYENAEDWDLLNAWPVKRIEQKIAMNKFPSYVRFARIIWVSKSTLFERAKEHKEFSDSMVICNDISETILLENWLQGIYNPWFAQFLLKNNYWYKDKTELQHSWEVKSIHDFTFDSMDGANTAW
mgnify:CR=1 FL=1